MRDSDGAFTLDEQLPDLVHKNLVSELKLLCLGELEPSQH